MPAATPAIKLTLHKIFSHIITSLCPSYTIYGIIVVDKRKGATKYGKALY